MAAAAGDGPSSPRQWVALITGVAIASSALSIVGVLGVQRLSRRRRRHELEEDIQLASRRAHLKHLQREEEQQRKAHDEGISPSASSSAAGLGERNGSIRHGAEESSGSDESTPRYLATLNALQDAPAFATSRSGMTTPTRIGSPRPAPLSASSSLKNVAGAAGPKRPSLPSAFSSSRRLGAATAAPAEYDETLIREQLSRNYSFLGDEAMEKLRGAFVIVVGAGGVGSWCAIMLLRSGVGRLRLIDFDQVSLSSLNRHACATLPDVGRPKVTVCKEKFAEIAPWADVDARVEIFRGSESARLLGNAPADSARKLEETAPAYVVDCIDNLDTKVDLLDYCYKNKIKCFSSMGAGAKADPSMIQVGDLNTTAEDPLARRVRRELRGRGVWGGGVLDKAPPEKSEPSSKGKKQKSGKKSKAAGQMNGHGADRSHEARSAALDQLEGKGQSGRRKLEDSGRLPLPTAEEFAESRKSLPLSRRTSSNSSTGAVFYSPMTSPPIDGGAFDIRNSGPASPYIADGHTSGVQGADPPRDGPMASDIPTSEANASGSDVSQRPYLAALQPSNAEDRRSGSRRASSLQELVAEDTRSSQAGRNARARSPLPSALQAMSEEVLDDTISVDTVDKSKPPHTIMCVYTTEKSDTRLLPLDDEEFKKGNVEELAALEDFRVRILPVLGPLPAMFGLAAATYVLCDIAGKNLEPLPAKNRRNTADRMWKELESTERKFPPPDSGYSQADRGIGPRRIPWTIEDVQYVFEEVYRSRSVVAPHETLSVGRLLRWDSTLPLSYSNVALFSKAEGIKHETEVLKNGRSPVAVWGDETTRMFKRRMAEERRMQMVR